MKYPDTGKPAPTPQWRCKERTIGDQQIATGLYDVYDENGEWIVSGLSEDYARLIVDSINTLRAQRDEAKQMLIGEHDAHMQCHAERDALVTALDYLEFGTRPRGQWAEAAINAYARAALSLVERKKG